MVERRIDEAHKVDGGNGCGGLLERPGGQQPVRGGCVRRHRFLGRPQQPTGSSGRDAARREQLPPAELPGVTPDEWAVVDVAAASGYAWATMPAARSIWKIDARIRMPYFPVGVAASEANVWVTVRAVPP